MQLYVHILHDFLSDSSDFNDSSTGAIITAAVGTTVGIIFITVIFMIILWYYLKKARPPGIYIWLQVMRLILDIIFNYMIVILAY